MVSLVPENDSIAKFPVTEVTYSMEESSEVFVHMHTYIYLYMDGEEHMNSYTNTPSISSQNHVSACKHLSVQKNHREPSSQRKSSSLSSCLVVPLRSAKVHNLEPLYKNLTQQF